jgi:sugar lactone lactonase YvrE
LSANNVAVGLPADRVFVGQVSDGNVGVWSESPIDPGATLDQNVDVLNAAGVFPTNVAVDASDGALYVGDRDFSNNGFRLALVKFVSDGAPTPTYSLDPNFAPSAFLDLSSFAVDPTTHDVLAVDPVAGFVYRLSSSGSVLSSFNGSGELQGPNAVAVGLDGTIYVTDSTAATVKHFSASGSPLGPLHLPGTLNASTLAVDPVSGDLAVAAMDAGGHASLVRFDSSGQRTLTVGLPSDFTLSHGLAWNATGDRIYYGKALGRIRTLVKVLQAGLDSPVVMSSARNIATVEANVATGGIPTDVRLEYCPAAESCEAYPKSDPSDAHNPWRRGPLHQGLNDPTQDTISDDLPLTSNTTWLVRATADNGTIGSASDVTTFDSPLLSPGAATGETGSVTDTSVVLAGTIDTLGSQTTYHFEYGEDTSYGGRVPAASEGSAGNNRLPRTVTRTVTGLQAGTTYHYRLVAQNSAGTAEGADRTFTTMSAPGQEPGYEQVTPVDKGGAQINSDFHVQTAADGLAIAVAASSGAADGTTTNLVQNYVVRRGESGWLRWTPTDAPQAVMNGIFYASTLAVSADFRHALVASNRALAPGGIDGGGNIYVKDLDSDAYTFVAGAPGALAYRGLVGPGQGETAFIAGAPDFSWVLFNGLAAFVQGAPTSAVYRWTRSGGLSLESLEPGNAMPTQSVQTPSNVPYLRSASDDGSVVYFAQKNGGAPLALYRRANGQTTLLSTLPQFPGSRIPARLDGVSRDGRYAVFTSLAPVQLTSDTPANEYGTYRYDAHDDAVHYLTSSASPPEVLGVSDDASTVYMTKEVTAVVWRNGALQIVSSAGVRPPDSAGGVSAVQTMSPNGRYFAWVASDGKAFLYDAARDEAACISCTADGTPAGEAHMRKPGRTLGNKATRAVTDGGMAFFDTPARLVTADHNGARDVYVYKDGRVSLISPGDGNHDAQFVDASDDGRSVFFQTEESLVGQDKDDSTDVYVARVGAGFPAQSPLPPRPPCVRSECGELAGGPQTSVPAVSQVVNNAGSSKRTNQRSVRLSIGEVSIGPKSIRMTFQASQKGRVKVTGTHVVRTIRNVTRAGTYSISVPLSKMAQSLRHAHKKFKVSVKVSLYGGWGSISAKVSRTVATR